MLKRLFTLLISLCFVAQSFSQDKEHLPRFSIRAYCAIPHVIGSQAFRESFLGVYDAGINFNLRLFSNFTLGVGYQNVLFNQTSFFKYKGLDTRLQVHDGVLRIGYDKSTGPKSFISISLSSGYGDNQYTAVKAAKDSLNGKYPTFFNSAFIRPEFSANFLVEDNFAFGVHVAYNMSLAAYDPRLNCFDTYAKLNFDQWRNRSNMGWISFGFGFYYGAKKKKA